MNLIESLLPLLLPLVAKHLDGQLPEAPKRLMYVQMVTLGREAIAKLAELQSEIPLAAFQAIHAEAVKEFEEAGQAGVPAFLDGFVTFTV